MEAILLFGMPGGSEWLVIAFFVLIFFGAKKIPEFARGIGKGIREFKDAVKDVKTEVDDAGREAKRNIDTTPTSRIEEGERKL
jgi:sec-independent protein translocase protein TatA